MNRKCRLKTMALSTPLVRRLIRQITQYRTLARDNEKLRRELSGAGAAQSPFFHYNSYFDAIDLLMRYERHDRVADDNHITNFLGVKISPRFFPGILEGKAGTVEPIPIPANWHADIAEWAAALRAVDLARGRFRAVELGCGWGCWLNNAGVAARQRGLEVELIGIEGDKVHVEFANEALSTNGFSEQQFQIIHGVAAPQNGVALFPIVENAGALWASEPILNASEEQIKEASSSVSG